MTELYQSIFVRTDRISALFPYETRNCKKINGLATELEQNQIKDILKRNKCVDSRLLSSCDVANTICSFSAEYLNLFSFPYKYFQLQIFSDFPHFTLKQTQAYCAQSTSLSISLFSHIH